MNKLLKVVITMESKECSNNCTCQELDNDTVAELSSRISPDNPDIKFFYDGCEVKVKFIKLSPSGEIESVVTYYERELSGPLLTYEKYLLDVPGVGYLCPGTRVSFEKKEYVLLHGWHTNGSNQTIFSWYLHSIYEGTPDKTLYKSDIDKLDKFTFV